MSDQQQKEFTDPALEGFSEEAFDDPGEAGLTTEQLALRVHLKREQAAQDAGWVQPPGPDEEVDTEPATSEVELEEAEPEAAPEQEEIEGEPDEEEGQPEEPEEPAGEPEEPEDEVDEFYIDAGASKYRSREDAEEGFAEKDRLIAGLYREFHEQQRREQEAEPQQLDVPAWSEWAAEAVESGMGIRGANQALESGGVQAFDIYMAHWIGDEDPDSRVQAVAFNNEVQRQVATQSALQAIAPELERSHARSADEEAEAAKQLVSSKYPDFADYQEDMDRLISDPNGPIPEETKQQLARIAEGGVEGKVFAWDHLYLAARAARRPRQEKAQSVERKQRTAAADAAKIAATVSTSEGTGVSTPPSEAELAVTRKRNAIREKLGQPILSED